MPDGFASLNAWGAPGSLYQMDSPVEEIRGARGDWPRLRELLAKYRRDGLDAHSHPQGAAVGYFTYEGDFHFQVFPHIRVLSEEINNPAWRARRGRKPVAMVSPWRAEQTRAQFESGVARAQEYIRAGDIYQVNLAQQFRADFTGDPYLLFEQLLWRSPAPGGAFLDLGDRQILSASPELFLRVQGRQITTRPIKGTRPRSRDPSRDTQLEYELRTDPKEIAELIMITDLERNDLGRVCEYGSVSVPELLKLERYPQVFHLVSTVEGMLRPEVDSLSALEACFPGGSITGAPKKRACEIIAEIEPGPRGVYTGAIGYFAFNGDAAFSIAIRTMVLENDVLSFHVGAGITADSVPSREYDETLHKASGLQLAVAEYARLAETARAAKAAKP